eukprot:s1589_g2.t7
MEKGLFVLKGAREAARAAALCAVKVAIAGNESPEKVGLFATMAAQSSGVEVVEATRLAAEAVSRAASESYELSTEETSRQVAMVKAAALATRVPLSVAADLVAAASGTQVAEQSLSSGLSPAWMSRKVQAAVLASGVGKEKSSTIAAKIAATAAASHAAADGAGPRDVRLAAQDALEGSGIAKQDADHLLAQVAAAAMAQRSARLGASASNVGAQAIEAAGGRSHGRVASEAAAEAMARLAVAASLPAAAGLVQEAARGGLMFVECRLAQACSAVVLAVPARSRMIRYGLVLLAHDRLWIEGPGSAAICQEGVRDALAQEQHPIWLAQSPQYSLSVQGQQVVILETGGVHHGHDWIVRPDGLILFASSPDMALSVDGPLQNGSQVVLRRHNGKPEPFNQWRWDGSGMLTLADNPSFDLNVRDARIHNGASVIVWQTQKAAKHNTWASEAEGSQGSSASLSVKVPFWLRVVGSRGDPNTLWSTLAGGISAQTGYVSCSNAMNRDTDSSWMYVHDDYYHSEHVTFLKVPYGSNFILKAVEKPLAKDSKKTNLGYLACTERIELDRRDAHSTYAYVHKDKSHGTQFTSEDQNDARSTLLYVQKQNPNLAAVFDGQTSFLVKYGRAILCCALTLVLFAGIWLTLLLFRTSEVSADFLATPRPLQINVPYDCLHQQEKYWSNAKKAWCCEHYTLGCPTTTPKSTVVPQASNSAGISSRPLSDDQDCYADVLYWKLESNRFCQPAGKQNWCCENHGIGCRASLHSDAYDCEISPGRGSLACKDCTSGSSDSWLAEQKAWCCYHAAVACPDRPGARYNCDAGYENWLHGWSQAKKVWCCFHHDRGCDDSDSMTATMAMITGREGVPEVSEPVVAEVAAHALAKAAAEKALQEGDGSLFLSHVDIVSKLAACDCVALQLPSEPKLLTLAAHSTGALTKGLLARWANPAASSGISLNLTLRRGSERFDRLSETSMVSPGLEIEVFFTELQPVQAAEIARRFFGDDFSVVAAPDEGEDWRLLPEVPLSPTAPPLVVAGLPVSRAAEAVKQLQEPSAQSEEREIRCERYHDVVMKSATEGEE